MTLFLQNAFFVEEAVEYGENRPPLSIKMRIFGAKRDPFFQNRGHANFTKKDPFSAKLER